MLLRHCSCFWQQCCRFCNNVERNFVLSTKSKQIEHVAKNGNNVEATVDFVEGKNFTINSFDIVAVFGNKVECWFDKVDAASTLLLVSAGLYSHDTRI